MRRVVLCITWGGSQNALKVMIVCVSAISGIDLDVFGDEVADIDAVIHVEFGEDVVIARRRVDLGGDFPVGESVRDGVGLAELALDLDEEGLHGALRNGGRLESGVRRYGTRPGR